MLFLLAAATPAVSDSGLKDVLPAKARELGIPVVADFGMNRCVQCIRQSAAIDIMKEETKGRIEWPFFHVGEEEGLTAAYGVLLIPTLIFFNAEGKEVFRNVGLMEADELRAKLKELGL